MEFLSVHVVCTVKHRDCHDIHFVCMLPSSIHDVNISSHSLVLIGLLSHCLAANLPTSGQTGSTLWNVFTEHEMTDQWDDPGKDLVGNSYPANCTRHQTTASPRTKHSD